MAKIEKNIPIPKYSTLDGISLSEMEVGDSFFTLIPRENMCSVLYRAKKEDPEFNYKTRKEGKGYRIWRVEK